MEALAVYRDLTRSGVHFGISSKGLIEVRGELADTDRKSIRDYRDEFLRIIKREQRRAKVLAMMENAPESKKYFWITDNKADPDHVILTAAIRDVGTCELSIPKERFDAFKLLEVFPGFGRED